MGGPSHSTSVPTLAPEDPGDNRSEVCFWRFPPGSRNELTTLTRQLIQNTCSVCHGIRRLLPGPVTVWIPLYSFIVKLGLVGNYYES